jgi:hypothetical protein
VVDYEMRYAITATPGRFGTRGVFLRGLLSVFTVHLFVKSA